MFVFESNIESNQPYILLITLHDGLMENESNQAFSSLATDETRDVLNYRFLVPVLKHIKQ